MALTISRVSALPGTLVANTIYMVAVSPTELQVVVVGSSVSDVRKTILTTDVDGKITTALATAASDAQTKADAAQAAAIAAAATDATTKADSAEADAIAAAATDATTKANAAQAAAITAASTDATTKANAALASANGYTDTTVANAIGNLDMSNVAILAADIAARDALTMTKNSFVVVADATGDPTVKAGAAMYFYNVADDSFMKIAEYESMDLIIPNKAILENMSDVAGVLHYMGEPIGTVVAGSNEW